MGKIKKIVVNGITYEVSDHKLNSDLVNINGIVKSISNSLVQAIAEEDYSSAPIKASGPPSKETTGNIGQHYINLSSKEDGSVSKEYVCVSNDSGYNWEAVDSFSYTSDMIANSYSNQQTYENNAICIRKGQLYKNTFVIGQPEEWDSNHWAKTNIDEVVSDRNENLKSTLIDLIYPVGAIYLSVNNVSPQALFGGQWAQIKDKFLLSAGDSYTAGGTGGSEVHSHQYGWQYGAYHRSMSYEMNPNAGLLNYAKDGSYTLLNNKRYIAYEAPINANVGESNIEVTMDFYKDIANASYESTLPPYLVVYMWKRIL